MTFHPISHLGSFIFRELLVVRGAIALSLRRILYYDVYRIGYLYIQIRVTRGGKGVGNWMVSGEIKRTDEF